MEIAREVVFRVSFTPKGKPKARNDIIIHPNWLQRKTKIIKGIQARIHIKQINAMTIASPSPSLKLVSNNRLN